MNPLSHGPIEFERMQQQHTGCASEDEARRAIGTGLAGRCSNKGIAAASEAAAAAHRSMHPSPATCHPVGASSPIAHATAVQRTPRFVKDTNSEEFQTQNRAVSLNRASYNKDVSDGVQSEMHSAAKRSPLKTWPKTHGQNEETAHHFSIKSSGPEQTTSGRKGDNRARLSVRLISQALSSSVKDRAFDRSATAPTKVKTPADFDRQLQEEREKTQLAEGQLEQLTASLAAEKDMCTALLGERAALTRLQAELVERCSLLELQAQMALRNTEPESENSGDLSDVDSVFE